MNRGYSYPVLTRSLSSRRLVAALLLAGCVGAQSAAACGTGSATITNLPTADGTVFQVNGLGAAGQLTGYFMSPGANPEAFLFGANGLVDIGNLGGPASEGIAVNSFGVVAGDSYLADFEFHAFLSGSNGLVDLGTLGGTFSTPLALNDSNQVVGASYLAGDSSIRGFFYDNGTMNNVGSLGGDYSFAFSLNNSGAVAGESRLANGDTHGFLFVSNSIIDLGTLGGTYSSASAINDAGVVVGLAQLATGDTNAFMYVSNVMTSLGTLGGSFSSAVAVNQKGQIIGGSTIPGDTNIHAFFYSGGVMTDLGTLGGTNISVSGLNNSGHVVGYSTLADGTQHAFIWAHGTMFDLNAFLPTNSNWVLSSADRINDADRVVGTGSYNGVTQPYIMDVVLPNSAPVAVAGPDQTVECPLQVTLDGSGSSDPDGDSLTFAWTLSGAVLGTNVTLVTSLPLGTNVVTLTVTDPCGAVSQANVVVRVVDTTPPTGYCPGPVSASSGADCQAPLPNLVPLVVASDTCTPTNALVITQNPAPGTLLGLGSHTVMLTVTDGSGNQAACGVQFTVNDTTPPNITSYPGPVTVSAGANCEAVVPNVLAGVLANDNCTPPAQLLLSQNPSAGTPIGLGSSTIVVSVSDASGNTSTANVSLTVADTTPPSILGTPGSVTVSVGDNCQAVVPNVVTNVLATDNCTPVAQLTLTQTPAAGTPIGLGNSTIVVTVSDASGNTSTTNVSLTVVDTTPPSILGTPGSVTVSVGDNCQAVVPNVLANVLATDNCTPAGQLTLSQTPAAGTLVGPGHSTIVVKVSDASGNISTANVVLNAVDVTPPSILGTPGALTVSADANCQAAVPNVLPNVLATDNCTPANQLVLTQNPAAGTVVGTGNYTILVSVADASGNTSTATVPLSVVDGTAPTILSVPGPITLTVNSNCQAVVPNVLTNVLATDNCTPANQLVMSQTPAAGTVVDRGSFVITVTVSDAVGNTSSAGIPLTVTNMMAPTGYCLTASPNVLSPPNHRLVPITVIVTPMNSCDAPPTSQITSVTCNESASPNDIQITGNLTLNLAATRAGNGNGRVYTITVLSTDAFGNSSSGTVTVTVPH